MSEQSEMRCTCGHREEDHAGGNCLQGELLDACDCYGFLPGNEPRWVEDDQADSYTDDDVDGAAEALAWWRSQQ